MDILRRILAPISPEAWNEIDSMARDTLTVLLSGRKFLDLAGPYGIDRAAVSLGRLGVPKGQKPGSVTYGVHQVLPLIEARRSFILETWELDNLQRGAVGIQLDPVVAACKDLAAFEEKAIYSGFKEASIIGLMEAAGKPLSLSMEPEAFIDAISEAQEALVKDGVGGGANLVVSPELWKFLSRLVQGGSLRHQIEKQLGGKVIYSEFVGDALLIADRGGDAELTLGQDLAIGYHSHTTTEVHFFLTESFTFRVIAPEALKAFKLG